MRFLAAAFLAIQCLAATALAQSATTTSTCPEERTHLTAYHFVVANETHDHLDGLVHAGDNVTIVFTLASCDGSTREGMLTLTLPTCASPVRTVALSALQDLDHSNATNAVERSLAHDVETGMACKESRLIARVAPFAPMTLGALAALAAAVFVLLRRPDG